VAPKRVSKKPSEVEDKRLHGYELIVVISPEVEDKSLDTLIENIGQFITVRGGAVSEVERWGKRKLAYPIEHFLEGNYVLNRFQLKPAAGKELEANLKISDEVLRHLLIKTT